MIDTTSAETIRETCRAYQDSRISDYEFRCIRFDAVIDKLLDLGLKEGDTILDVGSGRGEFARRLCDRGLFFINYRGVDGANDGVDLNRWYPYFYSDWTVAIEVIEHLYDPISRLHDYYITSNKGVVATTPNPRTVDVLGCDPTHVSVVTAPMFAIAGFKSEEVSLFKKPADSLLAWRTR